MKLGSLAFGGLLLSLASVTPASADFAGVAMAYLGPELPNYLTMPGQARCSWADHCWYRLTLGLDLMTPPAPPMASVPLRNVRTRK